MIVATGNIFHAVCDAVCITTNGFTKANGESVMGRGCAKAAAQQIPTLPLALGTAIKRYGNVTQIVWSQNNVSLLAFPVKGVSASCADDKCNVVNHMKNKFNPGQSVPGWACVASIELIEKSAKQLVELADYHNWKTVVLPLPGCGAGELSWTHVSPILEKILDDRFTCMSF
jgi:hypothetical protein